MLRRTLPQVANQIRNGTGNGMVELDYDRRAIAVAPNLSNTTGRGQKFKNLLRRSKQIRPEQLWNTEPQSAGDEMPNFDVHLNYRFVFLLSACSCGEFAPFFVASWVCMATK